MHVINARNANDALQEGLWWLKVAGVRTDSRNGAVIRSPVPVCTVYTEPTQRVLFSNLRDANPYFHYVEAMWMLAGRNDVSIPATYARQMEYYSDDGGTLNGAYGYRWRRFFGYDQLQAARDILVNDPTSRRAVIAMWSGVHDLQNQGSKDLPCNTQINLSIRDGRLDMMVCNRSNDIIWGAYGANYVHMSFLQQYMADWIGVPVGVYRQVSYDYHLYIDRPDVQRLFTGKDVFYHSDDLYLAEIPPEKPLFSKGEHDWWYESMNDVLLDRGAVGNLHPQAENVLRMIMVSHRHYRAKEYRAAVDCAREITETAWRIACVGWLGRRRDARDILATKAVGE